jgi:predicted ATPase/DNA-binding CsgD family transcriptional regulator
MVLRSNLRPTPAAALGKITRFLPRFRVALNRIMGHAARSVGQHNLPEELTSLIGRERDQAEVTGLLREHRIVSLVGAGGVGKTRLALRAARASVADFVDGVWLVELASLSDGGLVPQAVAAAVGVPLPLDRAPAEILIGALGLQQVLLILDNCEHLVQACAELVERLLQTCPRLRVLVASREPLGVPGEIAWPVSLLPTPDDGATPPERLAEIAAVRLFVERAQAARPDFALTPSNAAAVAQICRRLDGLPLALELAAARVKVLSPQQIATRLDDRFHLLVGGNRTAPARQQTLEAATAWSYDLLDPVDRRLFDRLSVFAGGFSLAAVDAVCAVEPTTVLDRVGRLVDQSLVVAGSDDAGERRYRLLETLRAYGRERLRARGEDTLMRERLTAWVLRCAEEAGAALRGPDQAHWLRWAEHEHDNIRSALAWAIELGDADTALRLVGALWWSWLLHDRWIEAEEWLDRALRMPGAERGTTVRARALHGAAITAALRGKYVTAQAAIDECLAIGPDLQDDELLLAGHSGQALLLQLRGESEAAQSHVQAMVELARRVGRPWYAARAAEFQASRALRSGDLSAAAEQLADAIRLARTAGDLWNVAMLLGQLGDVERMRGTHPRAKPLYQESIRLFQTLGLRQDPSRAHNLGYVALAEGQTGPAAAQFKEALAAFRRVGDRRGVAECLIGLGCVRAAERQPREAARLFAAGEAALEAVGSTVWPSNRADYQHWARIARAAMSTDDWMAEWSTGGALGAESILDEVLGGDLIPAEPPSMLQRTSIASELTTREREVAQLAAQGLSNRRIAELLVIAEKTAANHLHNALDKLDVHSRSQLAARAVELGLVPAASPSRLS